MDLMVLGVEFIPLIPELQEQKMLLPRALVERDIYTSRTCRFGDGG